MTDVSTKSKLADTMSLEFKRDLEKDGLSPEKIQAQVTRSKERMTSAPVVIVINLDMSDMDVVEAQQLLELARMRMPFGKYAGRLLIDLPEPYVVWFSQKGFPRGKLGEMLRIVYEIKTNGLEYLFDPIRSPQ